MDRRILLLNTLERHIARIDRRLSVMNIINRRLMGWRVLAFVGALVAGIIGMAAGPSTLIGNWLGMLAFGFGLIPFLVLVAVHRHVNNTIRQFTIWQQIKRTHLARMQLDWSHLPPSTAQTPPNHPFALDLDITGEHSIHQLIDTAVSRGGSDLLAEWLLALRPDAEKIVGNQMRIRELRQIHAFRDRLTLNGTIAAGKREGKWDDRLLLRWLRNAGQIEGVSNRTLLGILGLALINIVLLMGFSLGLLPPLWPLTMTTYVLVFAMFWHRVTGLFGEALDLQSRLQRLGSVLGYLENYAYPRQPHLRELCALIVDETTRPSHQIRRITWITAAASLQNNPVFWMAINLMLPWDLFFGTLLARSRATLQQTLPGWLAIWYELEALASLATFADLNPAFSFPTISPDTVFEATELGHPLIRAETRVTNDFRMDTLGEAVIITGSNMAGKSSFLRALGVNLRLAYCGSVVAASTMNAGLFRVFTSIRVTDSVVDGFSYFYAEVRRLKALLDALEADDPVPLFYLIDEIFRGTNNRERLVGSHAYLQALVDENGVGLVATHDLELVKLEENLPQIRNFHFREAVIGGKMSFDYRLRPGPCPTTNALKIMALEGLPVGSGNLNDGGNS